MSAPESLSADDPLERSTRQPPELITSPTLWWTMVGSWALMASHLHTQPVNVGGILRAGGSLVLLFVFLNLRRRFAGAVGLHRFPILCMLAVIVSSVIPWSDEYRSVMSSVCYFLLALVFLLFARHMARVCSRLSWHGAANSWRWTLRAGVACFAVPTVLGYVLSAAAGTQATEALEAEAARRQFELMVLVLTVWAVPLLLLIRALVITSEAASQYQQTAVSPWMYRARTAPAMGLLCMVYLTPAWIMLPAEIHYRSTPTFDEFLQTHGGRARLPELPDATLVDEPIYDGASRAGVIKPSKDNRDRGRIKHLGHRTRIRFSHGEDPLADLELQLRMQVREQTQEILGIEKQWVKHYLDPRFHAVARFLDETPEGIQVGKPLVSPSGTEPFQDCEIPVRIELCMASGAGAFESQIASARNLPRGTDPTARLREHFQQLVSSGGKNVLLDRSARGAGAAGASGLPRLWSFPELPLPGEGLKYYWGLSGVISVYAGRVTRSVGSDGQEFCSGASHGSMHLRNEQFELEVNCEEYSYGCVIETIREFRCEGSSSKTKRERGKDQRYTYHGKVW